MKKENYLIDIDWLIEIEHYFIEDVVQTRKRFRRNWSKLFELDTDFIQTDRYLELADGNGQTIRSESFQVAIMLAK